MFDGLRLVSLAQAACEARGWSTADRLAIVRHERVATFLLKKTPFTAEEIAHAARAWLRQLGFDVLYAPDDDEQASTSTNEWVDGTSTADYARLIRAADPQQFYAAFHAGHPPDDRRSAVLLSHDEAARTSSTVAFGRTMLFGNGLSALLTLLGISAALVVLVRARPAGARGPGRRIRAAGLPGSSISARSAPASC